MIKTQIQIVGDGAFGSFLQKVLSQHTDIVDDADIVFLAVPASAYDEVAAKNAGKHLVNICSVQRDTNDICKKYTDRVTGLHPLFGGSYKQEGNYAIATNSCDETPIVHNLFGLIPADIITHMPDGRVIDGALHDQMMAVTHCTSMRLAEETQDMLNQADWVPDECCPNSFRVLRRTLRDLHNLASGTAESILSNPYR